MKIKTSPNYQVVYGKENKIIDPESGESFRLTNRRWREINRYFGGTPLRTVKNLVKNASTENPATVLDIGAGESFVAANELYKKQRKATDIVNVVGVDISLNTEADNHINRVRGNALQLPFKDDSVDMAYSRQSLVYATGEDKEKIHEGLQEVSRVLKTGGIFFVDYSDYPPYQEADERLIPVIPEGTTLYYGKCGSMVGPVTRLLDAVDGRKYDFQYLALVKGEPSEAVRPLIDNGELQFVASNIQQTQAV